MIESMGRWTALLSVAWILKVRSEALQPTMSCPAAACSWNDVSPWDVSGGTVLMRRLRAPAARAAP